MAPFVKTLVIRFSSIGDIVLSTPLLRVLRASMPGGQIDYVTKKEYAELVRSNQNLNVTYAFDASTGFEGLKELKRTLKRERYDLVVDIHNSLRSRYLRSMTGVKRIVTIDKPYRERFLLVTLKKNVFKELKSVADRYIDAVRDFGVVNDGKGLELHIPDEIQFGVSGKVAAKRLNRFSKVIGLCPSARHATKRWLPERFVEVGKKYIREKDAAVMIFGGPEDVTYCGDIARALKAHAEGERVIDWTGQLSLLETAAAMEFCDVIITNDTGLMHIAVAKGRKVVAIFGSTVKEFGFFPLSEESVVVERQGLACRPCSHVGRSECPEEHFRCMMDIGSEEVYRASQNLIHWT